MVQDRQIESGQTSDKSSLGDGAECWVSRFMYPATLLRGDLLNYSKTDTHWSYAGAGVVFKEMAKKFFYFDPVDFLREKFGELDIRENRSASATYALC